LALPTSSGRSRSNKKLIMITIQLDRIMIEGAPVTTLNVKLVQSLGWLARQTRRAAMPRTHRPIQAFLISVLTRRRGLQDTKITGVFYVGLGDRFDDERRFVRESASEFRPTRPAK
jgi:hypothetical protein